jgi:hypothetical protein
MLKGVSKTARQTVPTCVADNTLASAPNQKKNLNFQSLYSIFLE